MQKTNQSQTYLEDSRVRINCSISAQTSQDSQHAVLWYVRHTSGSEADELLLRIERSGTFEYGAYADEERLRRRVQAERLSPRLYVLTLNRAESSDSGTYYCLVEEWLSDPDGAWYRVSRDTSGFTQVLVTRPGELTNRLFSQLEHLPVSGGTLLLLLVSHSDSLLEASGTSCSHNLICLELSSGGSRWRLVNASSHVLPEVKNLPCTCLVCRSSWSTNISLHVLGVMSPRLTLCSF